MEKRINSIFTPMPFFMLKTKIILLFTISFLLTELYFTYPKNSSSTDNNQFLVYTVNPQNNSLRFYWKDDSNKCFKSIDRLKYSLEKKNKKLLFAMNGGMYKEDNSPLGLYIENGKTLARLNTASATGNFYLKPNGVLYINNKKEAGICTTPNFNNNGNIAYATQSGPMLVIDGQIHTAFKAGSQNVNIRNGVGILKNNTLVFVMSTTAVNFYDFALYFKNLGCTNALYLDGFVSRTYLPEKNWLQTDGNFGVIIGVTES